MDVEYYINLADEAVAGFETTDSNSERSFTGSKMLSNCTACEIIWEGKKSQLLQSLLLPYFKKLPQLPQTSATSTLISQQLSTSKQDPPQAKRLTC